MTLDPHTLTTDLDLLELIATGEASRGVQALSKGEEAVLQAVEHAGVIPADQGAIDTNASWQRLSAILDGSVVVSQQGSIHPESRVHGGFFSSRSLLRWVAGVGVLTLSSVIATWGLRSNEIAATSAVKRIYKTVPGQRASVTLTDGSTVVLGPATTLRVSDRTVILDGQAIFTVNPKAESPFIVRAGNTSTTVLGTAFCIRKYASDTAVKVIVAQGRVSINGVVLSTGDIGTSTSNAMQVTRNGNITSELIWADGTLAFDRQTLRDVIPELERWYGIQIIADSLLLNKRVILTFNTESPADAIKVISTVLGARSEISGNRAFIYSH